MEWPTVADLVDQGPWYRNRGIVMVNLAISLALLTAYCNGFDGSMTNNLELLQQWETYFDYPKGSILGVMNNIQNIFAFLALPLAPLVSDTLGRRQGIFIGSLLILGGTALQSQCRNITQFILGRAMIGFGLSFSVNASPLLITELAYPTQRGTLTAMYNTGWYAGSIIAAWTTYGTFRIANSNWSWRIPSLLQALPSLFQVTLIWFCPESPRWLISKGRDSKARETLAKYHGNGQLHHPLVDYEFNEIREALAAEAEINKFSQWSGNGLVSYYLNIILETIGIHSTDTKTLINGILQIFNFGMALASALIVERVGRRGLFIASNAGMLAAFIVWTITSALFQETGSKVAANVTVVMIFFYYAFYDIAYTPLLVSYTIEILPFRMRAKGFAVMSITVVLGLVFNQFVNPIALEKLGWKYYIFYVVWLAFELVFVYVYLWETRGRTLEQTAVLFDGYEERSSLTQKLWNWRRGSSVTASTDLTNVTPQRPRYSVHTLSEATIKTDEDGVSERHEMNLKSQQLEWNPQSSFARGRRPASGVTSHSDTSVTKAQSDFGST
ncbi:hypothetical protein FRB97_004456 [Tulasnella sp. 331]|nr:hypothetical protein FRB97_004456 [Tulasnella sp. 331]